MVMIMMITLGICIMSNTNKNRGFIMQDIKNFLKAMFYATVWGLTLFSTNLKFSVLDGNSTVIFILLNGWLDRS